MELRSDLIRGALLGPIILGIGGRLRPWARTAAFIAICELISWRGVSGLLPLPQAMFMTLALVFLVMVDSLGRRSGHARANPGDQVQPAF